MTETAERNAIERLANREYEYGFVTEIESEYEPKGLSEDVVRLISAKKNEPQWLLDWRLRAYHRFVELLAAEREPTWAMIRYPKIDYQDMYYYAAPKQKLGSLDEVDPELLDTYAKLGIPLEEQKRLADASRAALLKNKPFKGEIVTEITKESQFYPAEGYHQDYYTKNPARYKFYKSGCGRESRLKQLWG